MQVVDRLINYFVPEHYDLRLDIEREKRTYTGTVTIIGRKISDGDAIQLHTKDLTITQASIDDTPCTTSPGKSDQLTLESNVTPGDHTITLDFTGTITDSMLGMYPCKYREGETDKELIATQFESHFARTVFPCVDEPAAKATFSLTLVTEPDITVLSNTPIQSQKILDGGRLQSTFETTPRMSTYLLAWVYGELQQRTATTKNGVEVAVYSTRTHPIESLDHPLEVACKVLDFYDEYYGVPYPLLTCAHVALPDFSSAAMENWGLVTYRESCLLAAPDANPAVKQYVATVIAHELAHQWFGNLVTMQWWDDLWLNESFANVMMFMSIDAVYPDWHIWNQFASTEIPLALARDQFSIIQPVQLEIHHPDEINAAFDKGIVYAKGSRLLRMVEAYAGHDGFRDGLRKYFQEHSYDNTTGADLWQAISAASGKDIESFILPWLSRPGYPVISITTRPEDLQLSQSHFTLDPGNSSRTWPILLSTTTEPGLTLMNDKEVTIPRRDDDLPLLNRDSIGHFITSYDDAALQRIIAALHGGQLTTPERITLLYEYFLLAQAGHIPTTALLDILSAYAHETTDATWEMIRQVIMQLQYVCQDTGQLDKIVVDLTQDRYAALGSQEPPADNDNDRKVRSIIHLLLLEAGHSGARHAMLDAFRSADDLAKLPRTLSGAIFSAAAMFGDETDYQRLITLHRTTADPELRESAAHALTRTRDENRLHDTLGWLENPQIIKPQDVANWYIGLLRNPASRDMTWRWLTRYWGWIASTFADDHALEKFPVFAGRLLAGAGWPERYTAFFADKSTLELARSIEIGTLEITARTAWIERDSMAVGEWLANRN